MKQGDRPDVKRMLEGVIGCKWSLSVLAMVQDGVNRPGRMTRAQDGLTTKVLNERLTKLTRFGVLERIAYPEIPPRVEYRLTDFGHAFCGIVDEAERLQRRWEQGEFDG